MPESTGMAILKGQRHTRRELESRTLPHILRGEENESVRILRGSLDLVKQFVAWAEERGCKYAGREFIISPSEPVADAGVEWTNGIIAAEFGYDPRNVLIVEHRKRRRRIGDIAHYHIIVPEYDPGRGGGVLDSRHSYPRQEKLARLIERHFGHAMTSGAHNVSVAYAVEAEHPELAKDLRSARPPRGADEPPTSYSPAEAAASKRAGVHAGDVAEAVRDAWSVSESGEVFRARLAELGLRVAPGTERPGIVCIWQGDRILRPLYRILKGVKNVEARTFLAAGSAEIARVPTLSPAEIAEAFAEELEKLRPTIDRSELDRVLASRAAATNVLKMSEEGAQRWEARGVKITARVRVVEAEAAKLGWLKRFLFRRCRADFAALNESLVSLRKKVSYAELNARQNRENVRDFGADDSRLAEREAELLADHKRQEDRNRREFECRSAMLDRIRAMALEADMTFCDREELLQFIGACRAEEEANTKTDTAPYMLRPGFDVGPRVGKP